MSDYLIHYGMPMRSGRYPWGSGDRPYQSEHSSAVSIYKIASEKEKTITKDIKEAAKNSNCKLYGLENRLKTVDSIQRKISKKQVEDNKSEKESMEDIHDSVRYTTISNTKDFVSNYELFKENMSDLGYVEIKCKNYFELFNQGLVKHKSVQSQFSTKDGFSFEVQFHTPESQEAKTKKIPLYEERRKIDINPKRAKELENEMERLALEVPDPPDIEKIKSHSNVKFQHSKEKKASIEIESLKKIEIRKRGDKMYFVVHSAKGTTWEDHKYIKRIDGTYYYPDDYVGGRHLPKDKDSKSDKEKEDKLEDWEKDLYSDLENTLKRNPGLFRLSEIHSDDFQDFRLTLEEFAGIDTDSLSDAEIERMRKKVEAHYAGVDNLTLDDLKEEDIEKLANEVIRGNFGNGQQRKELLGEFYSKVQSRVNQLMKSYGETKISEKETTTVTKSGEKATKAAVKTVASQGLRMDKVYTVYRK